MSEAYGQLRAVNCPRCGYDLRGTVSAWIDQCPLDGTCTECGLTLDWPQVIAPWKFEPTWCVEFVRGWQDVPRGCVRTILRSFRPVKFWRAHDMSHRLRWRRLVAYAIFLLLIVIAAFMVEQSATATRVYFIMQRQNAQSVTTLQSQVARVRAELAALEAGQGDLTSEERDSRAANIRQLLSNPLVANPSAPLSLSLAEAIVDGVTRPFSFSPPLRRAPVLGSSGIFWYPAPGEYFDTIISDINMTTARSTSAGDVPEVVIIIAFAGGFAGWSAWLFMPLGLAFLPITRRKAKVRWAHIGRVWAYSLVVPAAALASGLLIYSAAMFTVNWIDFLLASAFLMAGPFVLIGTLIWWRTAIRHYLQMPHALVVVILLSILVSLLAWFATSAVVALMTPLTEP